MKDVHAQMQLSQPRLDEASDHPRSGLWRPAPISVRDDGDVQPDLRGEGDAGDERVAQQKRLPARDVELHHTRTRSSRYH